MPSVLYEVKNCKREESVVNIRDIFSNIMKWRSNKCFWSLVQNLHNDIFKIYIYIIYKYILFQLVGKTTFHHLV